GSDVHVCTVLPGAVDTPIYQHAALYVGSQIRPPLPVLPVRRVVRAVVRCADHPRARVTVGLAHGSGVVLHTFAPRLYDHVLAPAVARLSTLRTPAPPRTGNLYAPQDPGPRTDGGWRRRDRRRALGAGVGATALLVA